MSAMQLISIHDIRHKALGDKESGFVDSIDTIQCIITVKVNGNAVSHHTLKHKTHLIT